MLKKFNKRNEGQYASDFGTNQNSFPILEYQYIIKDFIAHGYYTEHEVSYGLSDHGKIDWKRTVQNTQPQIDNGNVVYLRTITKRSINKVNILTRIHEYCVLESFSKLGWLYLATSALPPKPTLRFNKKMFLTILNDSLKHTFNSDKKRLFTSMIAIVKSIDDNSDIHDFQYGVSRFEYVWENLIDYVFGEGNKDEYFPHAHWHIIKGDRFESSPLEPDTIMRFGDKIFILDAKYYKFGITGLSSHLPTTSSIQKQITYGEYIATKGLVETNNIYNAFIMPYAAKKEDQPLKFVSVGTADWINYSCKTENYKYVLGILIDTRYLMSTYAHHNSKEIFKMSELILASIEKYRKQQ